MGKRYETLRPRVVRLMLLHGYSGQRALDACMGFLDSPKNKPSLSLVYYWAKTAKEAKRTRGHHRRRKLP